MDALRAEVARLQELVAVKEQVLSSREQLLASKDAQLAMKDELLAAKDQLLASTEGHTARSAKVLNQHEGSEQQSGESVKRQRLHNSSGFAGASPLNRDEVLDQIFSYVGGGDHLFAAGVSRRWRDRYLRHCALHSTGKRDEVYVTSHRHALLTERTLLLALNSGLSVKDWTMSR
jgi:hypothetical protein